MVFVPFDVLLDPFDVVYSSDCGSEGGTDLDVLNLILKFVQCPYLEVG